MHHIIFNKYFKQSFIIIFLGFISSCGGGDSNTTTEDSYTVKVNHSSGITFTDAKIKIRIYGTDKTVADNAATVISETVMEIKKLPSIFILKWPKNAYLLIKNPAVKSKVNAIYYFSVDIDMNNDGLLCNSDYRQDFKNTPFYTINSIPSVITDFYVTLRTNNVCETF